MVKKRRDKRVWFVALGVFVAVFLFSFLIQKFKNISEDVDAANLANFDPGYIISDYQMGNYNSMNEAQIQAFLKSKNHCNDRDFSKAGRLVGYLSEGSPYTWHVVDGHFVCMADENFNGESAAHIIYRAAQDYRINPQVLLVLLQKEQGLVTDTYPNSIQYRSAMGYGCPDTAACSSEYYGFKNQVRKAASLFRTVLDGGWSNYPVGSNYIQYAPNAACGGSWVNIRNRATSALYRYTPYQPNAGALAAGYGTAYCGAYGNRNFYLYFEDWFGGIKYDFSITNLENARIPDGTYSIMNLNSQKMIDIDGGVRTAVNGNRVHAWNNNNTEAQQWKISNNNDGTFTITNPTLGLVLNGDNGLSVEENRNKCSQKWKILKYDNDYVFLTSCSNLVLQAGPFNSDVISLNNAVQGNIIKWRIMPIDAGIDNGKYVIRSTLDNSKTVSSTVNNGILRKSSNIGLSTFSENKGQIWKIVKNSDGTYSFYGLNGLVLDVDGGSIKKGANVRMWSDNGSCAQKWKIVKNNDFYVFISACSDLVLDVDGGVPNENTNIHLWWFNNTSAQKWRIEEIKEHELTSNQTLIDGNYVIRSKIDVDRVVDINGGAEKALDGENIQLWRDNGSSAQVWKVSHDESSDMYSIVNTYNDKAIDVDGAQTIRGTNIQIWNSNYTCAQKWRFVKEGDYYTLISACSNLVLDVSGGKSNLGANINLWTANGTDAQKWFFELITE